MTRELFWLTLTVILTGLLWIPYIIDRSRVRGLSGAMANPSRNDKPHAEWATRLMFAHDNAVENLIIFAPLVLILNAIDYSSKWTVLACAVYFWSRVAHIIVYTIGLPVFRTLAFTVAFLAQAVLALAIFGVLRRLASFRGDANGLLAGPMTGSASNPESRDSGFALRAPRYDNGG